LTFGGALGTTRPNNKLLPGDLLLLAFDIENLKQNKEGLVQYQIAMDVTDPAGKSIYTTTPDLQGAYLAFGGTKLPANAWLPLKPELAAGAYSCKITITDATTKSTKELVKAFEILPAAFANVGLVATNDEAGYLHCPLGGVVGQPIWLNFRIVNFGRDAQTKQPDVVTEISVLENGKATNPNPLLIPPVVRLPIGANAIENKFMLGMSRAGSFVVQIKTEDKVTQKTTTLNVPITVSPAPK
jgi:hypothetical protein